MTKRQMRKIMNKEILKTDVNTERTIRFTNGCVAFNNGCAAVVVGAGTAMVIKFCINEIAPKRSKKKDVDTTSKK